MKASSVGSCGAGNSSDRVALFPYRDAVKYSYVVVNVLDVLLALVVVMV
jgi:hypothetical protein